MPPKRAHVSVDESLVLASEELEEIRNTLPPTKKLKDGRMYIRRQGKKRMEFWNSFLDYVEDKSIRAECKFCDKTFAVDPNKNGTKNLSDHHSNCLQNPENKGKGKQTELNYKPGFGDNEEGKLQYATVNLTGLRIAINEMVVLEECSFRFVESPGFVCVLQVACPKYICVSRFTVARDILKMYRNEKLMLKGVFRDSCQKVSITTDTWTSNQKLNYMCITAHFIDSEWKLQKRIINFCPITSHRGEDIWKGIEECLEVWGLASKLYTVTVDNASNNNTTCAYLQQMVAISGGVSKGKYLHMRCIAHIVNLLVWDGIGEDHISICRVRIAVKFIRNSPTRFQRLKDLGVRLGIRTKALLSQDCPTRWNSTYSMLNVAFKLRKAIAGISLPPSNMPEEQAPTEDDWTKVGTLVTFFSGFHTLTKRISGALYLTSNLGLIEISRTLSLLNGLEQNSDEKIKAMALSMRKKYDKYWGDLKKMNMMVYMALMLDPRKKFEYVVLILGDMFGVEEGKTFDADVKKCAYELFDEYRILYPPPLAPADIGSQSTDLQISVSGENTDDYDASLAERARMMTGTSLNVRSEFDCYLADVLGVHEQGLEALDYWRLSDHRYPTVARMARDILAIPLSTVASESAFSAGGRTIDDFRSSLNPRTVEALICTQYWIRARDRKVMREMEDNLKDIEELEEIEEEMKSVGVDDDDNVIYIVHP